MKLRTLLSLAATTLLSVSIAGMAQTPATPTGKIHGHVTDPTGVPKGPGTIGLSTDMFLAWLGTILFPWKRKNRRSLALKREWFPLFDRPPVKPKAIPKSESEAHVAERIETA